MKEKTKIFKGEKLFFFKNESPYYKRKFNAFKFSNLIIKKNI